jgi:hypothetical protein
MDFETAQLRQALRRAVMEREQYVRAVALLVKSIETQSDDLLIRVDGRIALKKEAFDKVPERYVVNMHQASVKMEGSDPNAPDEVVVVIEVADAKPRPTLVVASGMSSGGVALP